jgi:hypothetical protein
LTNTVKAHPKKPPVPMSLTLSIKHKVKAFNFRLYHEAQQGAIARIKMSRGVFFYPVRPTGEEKGAAPTSTPFSSLPINASQAVQA